MVCCADPRYQWVGGGSSPCDHGLRGRRRSEVGRGQFKGSVRPQRPEGGRRRVAPIPRELHALLPQSGGKSRSCASSARARLGTRLRLSAHRQGTRANACVRNASLVGTDLEARGLRRVARQGEGLDGEEAGNTKASSENK